MVMEGDSEETSSDVLGQFDQGRAEIAYVALLLSLRVFEDEESASLGTVFRADRELHVALLSKHPLLCNQIIALSQMAKEIDAGRASRSDPVVLHDFAAFVHVLTLSYEDDGAPLEVMEALDTAYPLLFLRYLEESSDQVSTLCRFLLQILDFVSQLDLRHSRVVLVEVPIGNSLAVTMLKKILDPIASVELLQVSLSRNDTARDGITRKELLQERLQVMGLTSSDVVIYVDEWNTGSNFHTLCKLQSKILGRSGAFFLPCAMLSNQAEIHDRYDSFCSKHDQLLKPWGRDGIDFRQRFPSSQSSLMNREFFWSEDDRITGWRKLQLHGSYFSSIDEAINTLANDESSLNRAIELYIATAAGIEPIPTSLEDAMKWGCEFFFESYQAYQERREVFQRCADELSSGGLAEDFESSLKAVLDKYQEAGFDEGEEGFAIKTAMFYLQRMGSFDPSDRYYFKSHAPIVVPLDGRMRRPHELTVEYIDRRLEELGA